MSKNPAYNASPLVRPTSTKAVVGFILSLTIIGFLPGIILGFFALDETHSGHRQGHGLAVAAITLGFLTLLWLIISFTFGFSVMNAIQQNSAEYGY